MKLNADRFRLANREPNMKSFYRIAVQQIPHTRRQAEPVPTDLLTTADVRMDELTVTTKRKIHSHCLLRIEVIRNQPRENIVLYGIVRWMEKPRESDQYQVGIELFDSGDSNRLAWVQLVEVHGAHAHSQAC